jgi:lysozyme
MRNIKAAGLKLIKDFEGLRLKPYLDSVGIPTIGYGTIVYPNGVKVSMKDPAISEEQAEEYLAEHVNEKASNVERMVRVDLNDNEFDALVCFAYNVGWPSLEKSTLLKLLNSNADRNVVADQFLRWNKAGGQELPGLTRRRQAERSLFLNPPANLLPEGPNNDDIEVKLAEIEEEIMKKS